MDWFLYDNGFGHESVNYPHTKLGLNFQMTYITLLLKTTNVFGDPRHHHY